MGALDEFLDFLQPNFPLGSTTSLGVGGKADWLAQPRNQAELSALVRRCQETGLPWRVVGEGTNLLVRDEGFPGVVVRLSAPAFRGIAANGAKIRAGAGALLAELIAQATQASLSGLEDLAGIPGSVGGALRGNSGEIGQHVASVDFLDEAGELVNRTRSELRFGHQSTDFDDAVVLAAEFDLIPDNPVDVVRRIKRLWIAKKDRQPISSSRCAYVFRDPRGQGLAELLDRVGLRGARVGGAEIHDRDPHFILAHDGAAAQDVFELIESVVGRVEEATGVRLDLAVVVW